MEGGLSNHIEESIETLHNAGCFVPGFVSDNYSVNVNAFSTLKRKFAPNKSIDDLFIYVQSNETLLKTYLFYDSVHLIKNIRNNLLNAKIFIFPAFA